MIVARSSQSSLTFTLKLDDDLRYGLFSSQIQQDIAGYLIQIGVDIDILIEDDADSHV